MDHHVLTPSLYVYMCQLPSELDRGTCGRTRALSEAQRKRRCIHSPNLMYRLGRSKRISLFTSSRWNVRKLSVYSCIDQPSTRWISPLEIPNCTILLLPRGAPPWNARWLRQQRSGQALAGSYFASPSRLHTCGIADQGRCNRRDRPPLARG
jgi:hypothetical protein